MTKSPSDVLLFTVPLSVFDYTTLLSGMQFNSRCGPLVVISQKVWQKVIECDTLIEILYRGVKVCQKSLELL